MPIASTIQTAFTAGEFSPKMLARVDLSKYDSGAETLENFLIMPWGGIRKRGGTKFIGNTRDDAAGRIVSFVRSNDQAYVLEFTDLNVRMYASDGVVAETGITITGATQANPVVITAANTYSNGDRVLISGVGGMFELNNREFTVANVSGSDFELSGVDGSAYTAFTSGGTSSKIVDVTTPYTLADIQSLSFTQSADTLYIAHPDYAPRTLVRNSATSWTISTAAIENGPFRDINVDDSITLYLSGGSATSYGSYAKGATGVTMSASSGVFTSGHVGSLWRLYTNEEGRGWSQLVGDKTTISTNSLYENAGNVYVCTADTMKSGKWDPSMSLPTHTRGTVRIYEDGNTSRYADMKYIHDGSVIVKVTAYTSATVVTVSIERNDAPREVIGSSNRTEFWEEGALSTERGWPAKVTFFEERLVFGNSTTQPQTVWMSRSGAFLDFLDGEDDDRSITISILSDAVDAIQWMNGGRVLSFGTTNGEYIVTGETFTKPLTPVTATSRRQTAYGSADNVVPARVGEVVIFAQRYGVNSNAAQVIRESAYDFQKDGYSARNITILSDHITADGVREFAYQANPYSVLWARRTDGQAASLTYEREQDVFGWSRQIVGGVSDASDTAAIIEGMAGIPGADGDEVWLLVQRYVNGGTVRHIERTTRGLDDDGSLEDAQYVDAHLAYSGASASTLTGLWHLRGETVRIFHSGEDQGTATVTSTGSVSLGASVTKAVVGYGYTAKVLSLRTESAIKSGTAQGKRKRISEATVRLYQSYGGKYGGDATDTDDIQYDSVELTTGDKRLEWPDGWNYDGRFYFESPTAYPFTVIGVMAEVRGTG